MAKAKVQQEQVEEEYEEIPLDPEAVKVVNWRMEWLRHGGFTKRNARLLATIPDCDYRYYNRVLSDAKAKGYDEDFVMKLLV